MNSERLLKMAAHNTCLSNVDQHTYPALHDLLYDVWDLFEGDNEGLLQRRLDDHITQTTKQSHYIADNDFQDQQFNINPLGSSSSNLYLRLGSSFSEAPSDEDSDERYLNGEIPEHELFGISQGHLECVKALNESYQGPYRLSYDPPLCKTSLLYWTTQELEYLKELVRLCPSTYSSICKMPIDQSSGSTKNADATKRNFWKDLKEIYEKAMKKPTWNWREQRHPQVVDLANANNMFHTPSPSSPARSMIKPVHANTSTLAPYSVPQPPAPVHVLRPTRFIHSTYTYYSASVRSWHYMYWYYSMKIYIGHFRNQRNV